MATQSITNAVLLAVDNRPSNPSSKVAGERQTIAVGVAEVETEESSVEASQEALEEAVSQLKAYVQNSRRDMDFNVDDVTGRVVVKVIDSESQQVIRQIPSEEMLAIARHLSESLDMDEPKGFLIELKA